MQMAVLEAMCRLHFWYIFFMEQGLFQFIFLKRTYLHHPMPSYPFSLLELRHTGFG